MSSTIKNLEIETIPFEEAKQRAAQYDYGIVHMVSGLAYGRMSELAIDWDELLELRAFSEKSELRVYEGNEGRTAQCCTEAPGEPDNVVVLEYDMRGGGKLAVKEYLEPDEDGQAVVKYTRPFAMR